MQAINKLANFGAGLLFLSHLPDWLFLEVKEPSPVKCLHMRYEKIGEPSLSFWQNVEYPGSTVFVSYVFKCILKVAVSLAEVQICLQHLGVCVMLRSRLEAEN